MLRPAGRAEQPEPTYGSGGASRGSDAGEDAAQGFCYCPGGRKRKRSSGAFCYCHPDSETDEDEDEDEGDEQQRLLNTPRRYRATGSGALDGRVRVVRAGRVCVGAELVRGRSEISAGAGACWANWG